ncbi:hypothetical protein AgCh_012015 [Apium graveolens]
MREYYAYKLMIRPDEEQYRLDWIRNHQSTILSDLHRSIRDSLTKGDTNPGNIDVIGVLVDFEHVWKIKTMYGLKDICKFRISDGRDSHKVTVWGNLVVTTDARVKEVKAGFKDGEEEPIIVITSSTKLKIWKNVKEVVSVIEMVTLKELSEKTSTDFLKDPTSYPLPLKQIAGEEITVKVKLTDDNILVSSTIYYAHDAYECSVSTSPVLEDIDTGTSVSNYTNEKRAIPTKRLGGICSSRNYFVIGIGACISNGPTYQVTAHVARHMGGHITCHVRMTMFLEATDPEYLDRIKEGPHNPTKLVIAVAGEAAKSVLKEKSDYTAEDITSIARMRRKGKGKALITKSDSESSSSDSEDDSETKSLPETDADGEMMKLCALMVKGITRIAYRKFRKGKKFSRKGASSDKKNFRKSEGKGGKSDKGEYINAKCYNCGEKGHISPDCKKGKSDKGKALVTKNKSWTYTSDSESEENYALMANADMANVESSTEAAELNVPQTTYAFHTDDINELRRYHKTMFISYRDQTLTCERLTSENLACKKRNDYLEKELVMFHQTQKDRDDAFYVRDEVLKMNESLKAELEKEREIIRTWTNSG